MNFQNCFNHSEYLLVLYEFNLLNDTSLTFRN